jgi:hypothetical protein
VSTGAAGDVAVVAVMQTSSVDAGCRAGDQSPGVCQLVSTPPVHVIEHTGPGGAAPHPPASRIAAPNNATATKIPSLPTNGWTLVRSAPTNRRERRTVDSKLKDTVVPLAPGTSPRVRCNVH